MNAAEETSFAVGLLLCICGSIKKNHLQRKAFFSE